MEGLGVQGMTEWEDAIAIEVLGEAGHSWQEDFKKDKKIASALVFYYCIMCQNVQILLKKKIRNIINYTWNYVHNLSLL